MMVFTLKSRLFSLDATTIKLCLSLFPWASFRRRKGGVKTHTLFDHDGHIPAFVTVTDVGTYESRGAGAKCYAYAVSATVIRKAATAASF
jgi:hypothetical protein